MKKLEVPEELLTLAAQVERTHSKSASERERPHRERDKRRAKFREERRTRRSELHGYAQSLFDWRDAFYENRDAWSRIWNAHGGEKMTVYVGCYWLGQPCPDSITTHAVLILERVPWLRASSIPAIFRYEERHKNSTIDSSVALCWTHDDLVEKLHPDFLWGAAEHLNGPDAWKYVAMELTRRLPRDRRGGR